MYFVSLALQTANEPWIQKPSAPCVLSTACIMYANIKKQLNFFLLSNLCWFKEQGILISDVGIEMMAFHVVRPWCLRFFLFFIFSFWSFLAISQDGVRGRPWNNLKSSITLHELLAQTPEWMPAGWFTIKWVLFFSSWLIFKHLLRRLHFFWCSKHSPNIKRKLEYTSWVKLVHALAVFSLFTWVVVWIKMSPIGSYSWTIDSVELLRKH